VARPSTLPRRVVIDGDSYRVHHTKRRPKWVKVERGGGEFVGYTDTGERRIWVQNTGNPEHDSQTLVHECDHVINEAAADAHDGIALVFGGGHNDLEEALVTHREKPFWRFLRDNDLSWVKTSWNAK